MDSLAKLCSEKYKSSGLESEVKMLTKLLAESQLKRKNLSLQKLATEDAVAAKLAADKRAQELTQEAGVTVTGRAQVLQVRDTKVSKLNNLVASLAEKIENAAYELDGATDHPQQVQSGQ